MDFEDNVITLNMPVKKEYSQILRLTTAGAFNQAGFDINTVGDAKVVVSEVFNCLLNTDIVQFDIAFSITIGKVIMEFKTYDDDDVLRGANEFTRPLLEALVTKVEFNNKGKLILVVEAV